MPGPTLGEHVAAAATGMFFVGAATPNAIVPAKATSIAATRRPSLIPSI
jgi:hypothetical protein